jgi:hypothetical protein
MDLAVLENEDKLLAVTDQGYLECCHMQVQHDYTEELIIKRLLVEK